MVIRDIQAGISPPGPDGFATDEYDGVHRRIHDLLYDYCWSLNPSDRYQMVAIVSQVEDIYASRAG
jgi:hypothetical protein